MEDKFWPEIINDLKLLLETKSNQDQEILRAHMLPGSAKTAPKSFRNCSDDNSIESVSTTEPIRRQSLIKIDSTIITTQHALIFSNWIDRKFNGYQSLKMAPYEFNLLLRGSRDGMDSKKFHKLCDNKGPTILVIRVKNSRQIVGGYNASEWDSSDSTKFSTECFLYSFADYNKLETGTIGRVKSHGCSVRCYKDCGPIFGNYEGVLISFVKSIPLILRGEAEFELDFCKLFVEPSGFACPVEKGDFDLVNRG
ncbi:8128_t:CDS:2 [Funneliformis caledonium]|uniref:8128_t:CDS:1 n=1 Tax=Funneliformis caledonium TaxID=1117310 RepID=A0A9N9FQ00_9GLOM|nr:8128_t:CDS:2 [Funneliformis caledonium]